MRTRVLVLSTVVRTILIPYPIFFVIGGWLLGFLPGLQMIHLDPDPTLYSRFSLPLML
jgi:hypothetical protein